MQIDIRFFDSVLVRQYSPCRLGCLLLLLSFFEVLLDIPQRWWKCRLIHSSFYSFRFFVVLKLVVSLSFLLQEFPLIPFLLLPCSIFVLSNVRSSLCRERVSANETLLSSN